MTIKFEIHNVFTKAIYSRDSVLDNLLYEILSYFEKGYKYSYLYKKRLWDGKSSAFSLKTKTFPTGLLDKVKEELEKRNYNIYIEDRRVKPELDMKPAELKDTVLRDYQEKAVEASIEMERGILDMSVGSGKTEIAMAITKKLNTNTLFIVHLKSLLIQTVNRMKEKLGVEPAVFGGGKFEWGKITVASIQSLHRNIDNPEVRKRLESINLVIVDEAHHIGDNTYKNVLSKCPAYYRFGLSGTPLDRSDGNNLYTLGMLGSVVYQVKPSDLIEKGFLVQPHVIMVPIRRQSTDIYYEDSSDWQKIYRSGIVDNEERNNRIVECVDVLLNDLERNSVLVMVREIKHGETLKRMLEESLGHSVPFLWGQTSVEKLTKELKRFKGKETNCVISSVIFDEGIDIPNMDGIVMAGGGKSAIKVTQRVGRGIRTAKDKDKVIIFDFIDKQHPVLRFHSKKRLDIYMKERKFRVSVVGKEDI